MKFPYQVLIENVPIVFSNDISPYGFGILGHEGLFNKLKLVFEFGKKQIEIIPKITPNSELNN